MVNRLHIIMPVKDSLDTTSEAIRRLYMSGHRDWTFTVYDDFSTAENAAMLDRLADDFSFAVRHWSDHTNHPSPNYLLTLQHAQQEALQDDADLLIIESDVFVQPDTIEQIMRSRRDCIGMIAAVTHDEAGEVNFPYLYAKRWTDDRLTEKRFSFCCTLLTNALLRAYPFATLDASKDWFDVSISHRSVALGFDNLLLMRTPVLHLPHSSRPWKRLKHTNPLLYYFRKLLHGRDKI